MTSFNHGSRLRAIWNAPFRKHFVVAIGLTPLFTLMAVWGWYTNVAEAQGWIDDQAQNSDGPIVVAPAGATNSVTALPASHAPSRSSAAFRSISLGHDHACGILTSGVIVCWGRNDRGQADPPDGEFKSVSAGGSGSCGIRPDDTAVCWGHGTKGTPNSTFSSISVYDTACGTTLAGSIVCWSDSSSHQVPADGSFQWVSLGSGHACALRTDATLHCWGRNDHGQANAPTGQFQSVAAGDIHNCGLRADGTVACWGADWHGRTSPPSGTYLQVDTIWDFSCGVLTHGRIKCWGINLSGEGDPPVGNFKIVETGARFACGLKVDATVVCWGSDEDGRLEPPIADPPSPVSNIHVCSGPDEGEVVVSWDAVLPATHYRIGYVNMIQDYPRATASVTGEWIEAFHLRGRERAERSGGQQRASPVHLAPAGAGRPSRLHCAHQQQRGQFQGDIVSGIFYLAPEPALAVVDGRCSGEQLC